MASEAEIRNLRTRVVRILNSAECMAIRFKLDSVRIETFMYSYIGGAIGNDTVHLAIGDGDSYDHHSNTITFQSLTIGAATIVHEATHAIIDATKVMDNISVGTHEATAYLAETLYGLNTGEKFHSVDVPSLSQSLNDLAQRIKDFNSRNKSGLFDCPQADIFNIKAVLAHSALRQDVDRVDQMDGIQDGPRGGLIGRMMLDRRLKAGSK